MASVTSANDPASVSVSGEVLSVDDARRYLRRRRGLMLCLIAAVLTIVGWRAAIMVARADARATCERQRASSELVVDVERRVAGLVQVRSHGTPQVLVPPARGDFVVSKSGSYLVAEGRVLPLDPSCAEAVP
jgi:hypothetical protein